VVDLDTKPVNILGETMKISLITILLASCVSFNLKAEVLNYKKVHSLAKTILKEGNYGFTDMKINDIETFCPSYSDLDHNEKNDFFAHLITEISSYESDFDTANVFAENNGNTSAGLLQISYPSLSEEYKENGCSEVKSTEDLLDATKNLKCGFAIIATLIRSREYISNPTVGGASSYWSTLRKPYEVFIKALNKTVTVGKKDIIIKDLKKKYKKCF
jgi:hypothetical protein